MGKIRIVSLDFDGCVFNKSYVDTLTEGTTDTLTHQLHKANPNLFAHLQAQASAFATSIFMLGSNRQSYVSDKKNAEANRNGSSFPALIAIQAEYAKQNSKCISVVDNFLLADVYGDLEDGKSFKRAYKHELGTKEYEQHAHWILDETKFTLLYAQMHRAAALYPNDQIEYDFYDDDGRDFILPGLKLVFETYPQLMPANVTLKLHKYAGKAVTETFSQQGTGQIDYRYRENVKQLAAHCLAGKYNQSHNDASEQDPAIVKIAVNPKRKHALVLDDGIDLASFLAKRRIVGYVLTQEDLAKSTVEVIQEFKAKYWIEFAGKNGTNEKPFYTDYSRSRLFFNGSNAIPDDEILAKFFAGYDKLQKQFVDLYSQGPMQTISTVLGSITAEKKGYFWSGVHDTSVVNFKIVNGELFAELENSNIVVKDVSSHYASDNGESFFDKMLHLPGSVKIIFKLKPDHGFELQTVNISNSMLKDLFMGEDVDFENEQVRQIAVMEEEVFAKAVDLQLDTETQEFFTTAATLLKEVADEQYSAMPAAVLGRMVVKEAVALQPTLDAQQDLPLVTHLIKQHIELVKASQDFAVMQNYHQAAEAVYTKPWGKRLGGAVLIGLGILAIAAAVTASVLTFGFGAIALAVGASVLGVGLALGAGGVATGAVLEDKARKQTARTTKLEGATKIAALATRPDQINNTLFRKSRVREYAEAHPAVLISLLKTLVNPHDLIELICKKRTLWDGLIGKPDYLSKLLANADLFKELINTLQNRKDIESLKALQDSGRLVGLALPQDDKQVSFIDYVIAAQKQASSAEVALRHSIDSLDDEAEVTLLDNNLPDSLTGLSDGSGYEAELGSDSHSPRRGHTLIESESDKPDSDFEEDAVVVAQQGNLKTSDGTSESEVTLETNTTAANSSNASHNPSDDDEEHLQRLGNSDGLSHTGSVDDVSSDSELSRGTADPESSEKSDAEHTGLTSDDSDHDIEHSLSDPSAPPSTPARHKGPFKRG